MYIYIYITDQRKKKENVEPIQACNTLALHRDGGIHAGDLAGTKTQKIKKELKRRTTITTNKKKEGPGG